MPTYEYACKECGHHIEVVQSFTDDALTECAQCGGELRKVFGSIGFVLKGSGFYKNDTRPVQRSDHETGKGNEGAKESTKSNASSGAGESTAVSKDGDTSTSSSDKQNTPTASPDKSPTGSPSSPKSSISA